MTAPIQPLPTQTVMIQTVTGSIRSDQLGFTLPHEHLANSIEAGGMTPDPEFPELFDATVTPELAWLLHDRPYACRDNCVLDNDQDSIAELAYFAGLGGKTVIEVTPEGQGRAPDRLREMSVKSGVQVISGAGWYLERYHPVATSSSTIDDLADLMIAQCFTAAAGVVTSGVIGEIGISPQITPREIAVLRAACRVQRQLGLPMFVHLPGFVRYGNPVLDVILREEKVVPEAVVLCHVDPSGNDPDYQRSLAERGVRLEFDMIGMPYRFSLPGEGQSPSVAETVSAIERLCTAGFGASLLVSHDMFLKGMLRKNGGNGLAYIPAVFLKRLVSAGVDPALVANLNTSNVQNLFEAAARGRDAY